MVVIDTSWLHRTYFDTEPYSTVGKAFVASAAHERVKGVMAKNWNLIGQPAHCNMAPEMVVGVKAEDHRPFSVVSAC
jgi:hypothetical protein